MVKGKKLLFPFGTETDELLSYCSSKPGDAGGHVEWRENCVFDDHLEYRGYRGGRSSMTMLFVSLKTRTVYPMFWTFFEPILQGKYAAGLEMSTPLNIIATFTFCKMGQNYSIKPVTAKT